MRQFQVLRCVIFALLSLTVGACGADKSRDNSGGDGSPEVREIVFHFHDGFAAAEERIERVSYYKDLHDELHAIHTRSFSQLVSNANWFPDELAVTTLYGTLVDLEGNVPLDDASFEELESLYEEFLLEQALRAPGD